MAKNYILEPMELTFTRKAGDYGAYLRCNDASAISPIYPNITVGMIFDFNNGDKFIVESKAEYDGVPTFYATRDGKHASDPNAETVSFSSHNSIDSLTVQTNKTNDSGTYTVSIYTDEDDTAPTKNLDFSDHPRNDIEGTDDLLDDILGLKDEEKEPTPAPKPSPGPMM